LASRQSSPARLHTAPAPVPRSRLRRSDFAKACLENEHALIYFLLNVGDGDSQMVLFPADETGGRRMMVVDIATRRKLPALLDTLAESGVLRKPATEPAIPIVVGTHPHDDHIGGMPEFLERFGPLIGEYWEPGYYHPTGAFVETMAVLEEKGISRVQPTSGMTKFIDKTRLVALGPSVSLRVRFDSYGAEINDASIVLKIEYPAARVAQDGNNRRYLGLRDPWSLILGADAQTTSWAHAVTDFPRLHRRTGSLYEALKLARGADHLRGHILKVPHHASKHGVNIELVERMRPRLCLISSSGGVGSYGFPHMLAVEAIREARQPTTRRGGRRKPDIDLGIHYTSAVDTEDHPRPLGSIALMVPPEPGGALRLWRFGDRAGDRIRLDDARECSL
jgi:beta-lactamase superfamily II metal-dependent hydrolase